MSKRKRQVWFNSKSCTIRKVENGYVVEGLWNCRMVEGVYPTFAEAVSDVAACFDEAE